jgi:hypothetical protein
LAQHCAAVRRYRTAERPIFNTGIPILTILISKIPVLTKSSDIARPTLNVVCTAPINKYAWQVKLLYDSSSIFQMQINHGTFFFTPPVQLFYQAPLEISVIFFYEFAI